MGLALIFTGIGIYFAKAEIFNVLSRRQNFLSEFLAVADNMLSGENPAEKISPSESQKNTPAAPAAKPASSGAAKTGATAVRQQSAAAINMAPNQAATSAEPSLCSFNGREAPLRSVLINEAAWAGTASDKTAEEWIELKNNSGSEISLNGWQMQNISQNIKVFFGISDLIPAGGFYLLKRGSSDFIADVKADKFFSGAVKNSDEAIRLFDRNCGVVDEVIADIGSGKNWPAGAAGPDYRAAERSFDLSWHTYSGPPVGGEIFGTPRKENSLPTAVLTEAVLLSPSPPLPPSPPPPPPPPPPLSPPPPPLLLSPPTPSPTKSNVSHILISQVQISGGPGQTTNDFIEIYNPSGEEFNLKGHRLVKRTQTGASDTLIKSWTGDAFIPAYGFYLWANSGYSAIAALPDSATTASIADNNGIAIRSGPNDTGTVVDSVAWGNAENVFIENAAFSENPGANQGLMRKSWQGGCGPSMFNAAVGSGCDSDNNGSDFELMPNSQPRNSQSQ